MKATNQITFGIELEGEFPRNEINEDKYYPVGYHDLTQVNQAPEGWITKTDGSLSRTNHTYFNAEIVSPVLFGEQGLVDTVYMIDMMNNDGFNVNNSCGLHIHVGVQNWSEARLNTLKNLYIKFEKAFYALNGQEMIRRWNNQYCHNSTEWDNSRYNSLSFNNTILGNRNPGIDKQHVEYRLFAGSTNPRVILCAILMAVALVSEVEKMDENVCEILSGNTTNPFTTIREQVSEIKEVMNSNTIIPDYIAHDVLNVYEDQIEEARPLESNLL